MQTIDANDLLLVTGAGGLGPLSGDVTQQINTNWGGTQIIHPPKRPDSPLRFEYLRQHPEARWGAPPYKPTPVRKR